MNFAAMLTLLALSLSGLTWTRGQESRTQTPAQLQQQSQDFVNQQNFQCHYTSAAAMECTLISPSPTASPPNYFRCTRVASNTYVCNTD